MRTEDCTVEGDRMKWDVELDREARKPDRYEQ